MLNLNADKSLHLCSFRIESSEASGCVLESPPYRLAARRASRSSPDSLRRCCHAVKAFPLRTNFSAAFSAIPRARRRIEMDAWRKIYNVVVERDAWKQPMIMYSCRSPPRPLVKPTVVRVGRFRVDCYPWLVRLGCPSTDGYLSGNILVGPAQNRPSGLRGFALPGATVTVAENPRARFPSVPPERLSFDPCVPGPTSIRECTV